MSSNKKIRTVSIIAAAVLIGIGAFLWLGHGKGSGTIQANLWHLFSGNTPVEESNFSASEDTQSSGSSETELYLDPEYRFSFEYPEDFTVQPIDEETGEVILAQGPGEKNSFQIFISPFDEDMSVMTPERIRQDLPNMLVENSQEIILSNDKHALMFFSQDPALGNMREVWVIDGGYLYQISAYAEFDAKLAPIMKTFKFGPDSQE